MEEVRIIFILRLRLKILSTNLSTSIRKWILLDKICIHIVLDWSKSTVGKALFHVVFFQQINGVVVSRHFSLQLNVQLCYPRICRNWVIGSLLAFQKIAGSLAFSPPIHHQTTSFFKSHFSSPTFFLLLVECYGSTIILQFGISYCCRGKTVHCSLSAYSSS